MSLSRPAPPPLTGWARYCRTCHYLGPTGSSYRGENGPCAAVSAHTDTELLLSYKCESCGSELLFRNGEGPRRAEMPVCVDGGRQHTPAPAAHRKVGTCGPVELG